MMPVLITCHRRVCSQEGVPVPGYRPGSLPAVLTSVRPAGGTAAGQEEEQAAPCLPRRWERGVSRSARRRGGWHESQSRPAPAGGRDR
jgi:hypothetical protein